MSIIRDTKKLQTAISGTLERMRKVSVELAEHAVSVSWHLGTHRNPTTLNYLFSNLNTNMQAGFKRWLVKVSTAALTEAGFNDVSISSMPFRFEKDKFKIVPTEKDARSVAKTDAIAAYMAEHENDVGFGNFMDIDTDKEKDPFSILSIEKVLEGLMKKADKAEDLANTTKLALAELVSAFKEKTKTEHELAEGSARLAKYKIATHVEDRPTVN